jgi:predicted DNA-binding transcriptional regulator AlpA
MLRIEQVAKRIGRTVGTTYNITSRPDFPPPRKRIGVVKLWGAEDVRFWKRSRKDGRAGNGRKRKT